VGCHLDHGLLSLLGNLFFTVVLTLAVVVHGLVEGVVELTLVCHRSLDQLRDLVLLGWARRAVPLTFFNPDCAGVGAEEVVGAGLYPAVLALGLVLAAVVLTLVGVLVDLLARIDSFVISLVAPVVLAVVTNALVGAVLDLAPGAKLALGVLAMLIAARVRVGVVD